VPAVAGHVSPPRIPIGNFRKLYLFNTSGGYVPHANGGIIMKKLLILSAVSAFAATAAFGQAAVSTEYYVVRDASTKKCTVVDKKPTTTTTTIVGNGTFKTRTEAETGMKTIKVCTEN
jgi:hypothetical protein